jgi:hypothetical protein
LISTFIKRRHKLCACLAVLLTSALVLAGCTSGETPTPTGDPGVTATETPVATAEPGVSPTTSPTVTDTPVPTPTAAPTLTPVATVTPPPTDTPPPATEPPPLTVLSPLDGLVMEVGAVRLVATAPPDAVVAVNGEPVDLAVDGSVQYDIVLEEGPNTVEVLASLLSDQTKSESVVVFYTPPAGGLTLTLSYPEDALEVEEPTIWVVGGTETEATVAVNGTPAEVNVLGLFSANVELQEGPNLIEVLATDLEGNSRSQSVTVFYVP